MEKDQAEIPSYIWYTWYREFLEIPLLLHHTRVMYKVFLQLEEENVANDSNPLSWAELSFRLTDEQKKEFKGLWDLAITSASTWLKHLCKYGLLESVAVNGTYTKSDKR